MSVNISPYSKSLKTPLAPTRAGFSCIFLSCAATLDATLLEFRYMRSCTGFPRAFAFHTTIFVKPKVSSVASTSARSSSNPETSAPKGVPSSGSFSMMLNIDSRGIVSASDYNRQ